MNTTVYFATNRQLLGDGSLPAHYAGESGPAGQPGRVTHAVGFVEGTDLAQLQAGRLARIESVAADDFAETVQADLSSGRNLLVFIHGFANSFTDSITRAAFNREWLAASGIPAADCSVVSFSWPSRGVVVNPGDVLGGIALGPMTLALKLLGITASPLANAYFEDQAAAAASAADVISFLDRLRPAMKRVQRRGGRVFLLAHSMGNWVLEHALNRWASMGLPSGVLFDEALSAAADTPYAEAGRGPAWLGHLAKLSGRLSLYHSAGDQVLRLSQVVNNVQRLGRSGPTDRTDLTRYPRESCRFVDCERLPDTGPGLSLDSSHQFYRRIPEVRDDMARVMDDRGAGGRVVL
ncbi:alpha/beta fold hydrolase [Roseococcus sp. SDR]|uniref:alpha/beta fold hydrolase n=1 Tax=Roseococcus sp. SDR TaxID=2835532 RepID=UPI001BCF51AB|nr:alpha/beta fold hydrolase [Roseococcus sp. SDR]MBS7788718.1 alpha/beta fold hydrolase [Roseococcus sp. SDR]MBV1844032.1 alpha/beta fold hydrolase [Roseococcus sp. SDR]